ncbi:hypothetical protein E4U25_006860 [Claviceps purpurea]|nr:hypothetical protein E4U25_006860 [Claviceps purpurea]
MTTTLVGRASIRGGTETGRMILLNFCAIGITFTWIVEMTYCTPYLLNLGLTKSNTSLIWLAGPLSGLLVQPIIGVISDENTSIWGRRRPLMVAGALIVACCLIVLGFTRELVGLVLPRDSPSARAPTLVLAVLSIYVLDFAINAIMSCSRSLIVDVLPLEKQQEGAAWASRMNAVGHIIGYSAAALNLPSLLGATLGATQFQQLTVIAILAILSTTGITCWAVRERVLVSSSRAHGAGSSSSGMQNPLRVLRHIYSTVRGLPPRVRAICWAQFWSWIGWFPFMFYSTTWVGETYFRYDVPAEAKQSQHKDDALGEMGRIGSSALVLYSTVTCVAAFVLPILVKSPDEEHYTARPPPVVAGLLTKLQAMKPDLLTMWILGHCMFAGTMVFAPFATSFRFATVLVCLCGIPWTIAGWAPTALLGIEVNKMTSISTRRLSHDHDHDSDVNPSFSPDIELASLETPPSSSLLGNGHGPESAAPGGELSGIYFGILNIYTTIPQFIGSLIAAVVFAILEPGKSKELTGGAGEGDEKAALPDADGPNAIAVCLFIGAVCALGAGFVTMKLRNL